MAQAGSPLPRDEGAALDSAVRALAGGGADGPLARGLWGFVEESSLAFFLADPDGKLAYMNPAAQALLGVEKDEAMGKAFSEYFSPYEEDGALLGPAGLLAGGSGAWSGEVVVRTPHGGLVCSLEARLIEEGGRPMGVLGALREGRAARLPEALDGELEALRMIAATARDAIVMMDADGRVSFWNPAAERIFGYSASEARGREIHSFIAPSRYYDQYRRGFALFRGSGEGPAVGRTLVLQALRKDGEEFSMELSLSAVALAGRWHAVGIVRDITERKRAEEGLLRQQQRLEELVRKRTGRLRFANESLRLEISERRRMEAALRESEKFLSNIFESIRDPFCIIDRDFTIVMANEEYARNKGRPVRELAGRTCFDTFHGRREPCPDCVVQKTLLSGDPCAKVKLERLADGSEAWLETFTYPIFAEGRSGQVAHVIEYMRDITGYKKAEMERKRLIDNLGYLSMTDSLTAALNRRALVERLECEISRARRYGSPLSVILLDIDGFKDVNDTHGHVAGDRVLRAVSDTLKGSLRKTDVLGRLGGDEFMVVLPATALEGAEGYAERIRRSVESARLSAPGSGPLKVTLSLGVTVFGEHDTDADSLIRRADRALYASKNSGKNRVSVLTR
ncbi:MAG: hypothetical protein Kow0025_03060 [Thermodesulfovibrionales bacterium]